MSTELADLLLATGEIKKELQEGFSDVLRRVTDQHHEVIDRLNIQEDLLRTILALLQQLLDQITRTPSTAPPTTPAPVGDFVGREHEIEQLEQALKVAGTGRNTPICGIFGMSGLGKSELALKVAHDLRDDFPDGRLRLDLRGTLPNPMPPQEALRTCLDAFGVDPKLQFDTLDALQAHYQRTLNDKRVLILADNAKDKEQVDRLVPLPSGCALLVTSQYRFKLPIMHPMIDLEELQPEEAKELLIGICERIKPAAADMAKLCRIIRTTRSIAWKQRSI